MRHHSRGALALALALCLVAPACAENEGTTYSREEREDFLRASMRAPREFTYTRTEGEHTVEVRGRSQDDYEYEASVSHGGSRTYDEVVVDDRRWVLLHDATALPTGVADAAASQGLVPGRWLADANGAPGEFRRASEPVRVLGGDFVLEVVRALERPVYDSLFQKRITRASKYDPESVNYIERNDKFPPHVEDGVRFDVFPAPYEPDFLFRDGIPADLHDRLPQHFLFASFWYDGKHLTRVELFLDIDVERVAADMREAAQAQAGRVGGPVDGMPLPRPPQPFRATYTFRYPEAAPPVTVPVATGTVVLPVDPAAEGTKSS